MRKSHILRCHILAPFRIVKNETTGPKWSHFWSHQTEITVAASPRNGVSNKWIKNPLISTHWIICLLGPCRPVKKGDLAIATLLCLVLCSFPSAGKALLLCTSPQNSFLSSRLVVAQFMNHWIKLIKFLKFTQLNFAFSQYHLSVSLMDCEARAYQFPCQINRAISVSLFQRYVSTSHQVMYEEKKNQ